MDSIIKLLLTLFFFSYKIIYILADYKFSLKNIGIVDISKKIDPVVSNEIYEPNKQIKINEKSIFNYSLIRPVKNMIYKKNPNFFPKKYQSQQKSFLSTPIQGRYQAYFHFQKARPNIAYFYENIQKCNKEMSVQADPNDCRKYIICTNQRLIRMSCPKFLVFDLTLKSCNYSKNVKGKCRTNRLFF